MNALAGARCSNHRGEPVDAQYTCHRCGSFFCEGCARRTRPEAVPICASCFELRGQKVVQIAQTSPTRLQTAGLVLGCICLLPIPALIIASLVVNGVAIYRAKEGPARVARWKPILGLCLTMVGVLELVVGVAVLASR